MSLSYFLYCEETKQAVHIAEQSSTWFRGADFPSVVGAFCLAHEGKELRTIYSDDWTDRMDYEIWERENAAAGYYQQKGGRLPGL